MESEDNKKKKLEGIIDACKERFDLPMDENSKKAYMSFLKRRMLKYGESINLDYVIKAPSGRESHPYRELLMINLKMYSYLAGIGEVIVGRLEDEKNVLPKNTEIKKFKNIRDAYMFRLSEMGVPTGSGSDDYEKARLARVKKTDKSLYSFFTYIRTRFLKKEYKKIVWPNWGELIDSVGSDRDVKKNLEE